MCIQPGGGGALPDIGQYGEAPPERDTFYMLEVYKSKRVWISQDEVYKG